MGRIKTAQVKSLGKDFVKAYPDRFTTDFDKNKEILATAQMKSKWLKNRLAGYTAKLMKQKARGVIITAPQKQEEEKKEET